jgi:hypothetical protein
MPAVTVPSLVKTPVGTVTTANAAQVAVGAAAALRQLNEGLAELESAADESSAGDQIAASLRAAIDGLRREGIAGVTVNGEGAASRLMLNQEAFVTSLSAPGAHTGEAVDELLDRSSRELAVAAASAAARGEGTDQPGGAAPQPPSGFEIANRIRSQMAELLESANARAQFGPDPRQRLSGTALPAYTTSYGANGDGEPRTFLERLQRRSRQPDGDEPLHYALLPLDDDEDDELITF